MESILVALITALLPALVTLATSAANRKREEKHAARSSILQLILEDKVAVMEGKKPENHIAILEEFDNYRNAGGNSYIHEKVDDYEDWLASLTVAKKGAKKNEKK